MNTTDGDSDSLRRNFSDIRWDGFTSLHRAFEETTDRVLRHLARFLQSLTVGADLRDRWNQHVVPALGQGLEYSRVTVFGIPTL